MARVERFHGVLEDHLQLTAVGLQLALGKGREIDAFEQDLAARRLIKPHDAFSQCGFAAARFADEPERLAGLQGQRNAVDGLADIPGAHEHALAHGKVHAQVTQFEQGSGWSDGGHNENSDGVNR